MNELDMQCERSNLIIYFMHKMLDKPNNRRINLTFVKMHDKFKAGNVTIYFES